MASRGGLRPADRATSRDALTKAEEFLTEAETAASRARWNAAGLSAVHSGIAAADAALIASAGVRSTGQDHGAVIALLEDQVPEFSAAQRRQLGGLLKMKNTVAYEQRLLTETECRQLLEHAARLARWARETVSAHLG